MQPWEIYFGRRMWRNCPDERPWLVIEIASSQLARVLPISGACYNSSCFPLEFGDPDFPATGLRKSCFIIDDRLEEMRVSALARFRGRLEGDLLRRFREYSGM